MHITVIGAANIDIIAGSKAGIMRGDSNPAKITLLPGGVGRNIAENLIKHGAAVDFITAVGADLHGAYLRDVCRAAGINTKKWIVRGNISTGLYIAALDCDGELYVGFNDMSATESIAPDDLTRFAMPIKKSDLLVVDANLAEELLSAIPRLRKSGPVMADAASAIKAPRLKSLISSGISILKANRAEAEALAGRSLETPDALRAACNELVALGARRVFITLGAEGACAAEKDGFLMLPALPARVSDVTGAGDAFAAGIILSMGEDLKSELERGLELAARHLQTGGEEAEEAEEAEESEEAAGGRRA